MNILKSFFSKKTPPAPSKERESDLAKMQTLIDYIGNHSTKLVIRITAKEENATSLTSSKFGGYPYWPSDLKYPCNNKMEKMLLLAQINFNEVGCNNEHLPQTGILQFFITSNDLYGQNFDDHTEQSTFRVVYHEEINPSVTLQSVKTMGIRANTDLDPKKEAFPLYVEMGLEFTEDRDTITYNSEDFRPAMAEALKVLYNEELKESIYRHFTHQEYDYLAEKCGGRGSKMMGFPAFTQEDPRGTKYTLEEFDTLLLQIDSDCKYICWGDSGICNFFINSEALKQKDFSRVLYNWDCY